MRLLEHRFGYGLTFFVFGLSLFGTLYSLTYTAVSQWMPLFVGVSGAVLSLVVLLVDLRIDRRARARGEAVEAGEPRELDTGMVATADEEELVPPRAILLGFAIYFGWFAGFAVLFLLLGMPLAVLLWVLLFVRFAGQESWLRAGIGAVVFTGVLFLLAAILALGLPHGVLVDSGALIPNWRL